eukprot:TRINITY_DN26023_c0_g1_i1.p1 TRINITY_DN26023_c0_g1~~TRINITY_DN26023_c0_g1_i1.p1  ORF type:complete len:150 (+),score=8.41 TRINITY_DN26023_c0_g1_i1:62-511(+)
MSNKEIPLGTLGFDARYTVAQILTLQGVWYLSIGLCVTLYSVYIGEKPTLGQVFGDDVIIGCNVVASALLAFAVHVIVERSRKCLDFSVTVFLAHVSISTAVSHLLSAYFFLVMSVSATVTYLLSRRLCYLKEMNSVAVGSGSRTASPV